MHHKNADTSSAFNLVPFSSGVTDRPKTILEEAILELASGLPKGAGKTLEPFKHIEGSAIDHRRPDYIHDRRCVPTVPGNWSSAQAITGLTLVRRSYGVLALPRDKSNEQGGIIAQHRGCPRETGRIIRVVSCSRRGAYTIPSLSLHAGQRAVMALVQSCPAMSTVSLAGLKRRTAVS